MTTILFVTLYFIIIFSFYYRWKKSFILLPTYYALSLFILSTASVDSDLKYGFHFILITILALSFVKYHNNISFRKYIIIILFVIYILLIFFLKSEQFSFAKLSTIILIIAPLLIFVLINNVKYNFNDVRYYFNVSLINLIISLFYLLAIQVYNGSNTYMSYSGTFYVGAFYTTGIYFVAFNLIVVVYDLIYKISTKFTVSKIIMVVIWSGLLVLIMRRTAIALLLFSALFLIYKNKNHLGKIIYAGFILAVGFLLTSFVFSDFLAEQMDSRSKIFERSGENYITEEARYAEIVFLLDARLNGTKSDLFFGRNMLDNRELGYLYVGRDRPLHIDWSVIFHGGGLVGVILFISLFVYLYFKVVNKSYYSNKMYPLALLLMINSMLLSIPGGFLRLFHVPLIIYLFFGLITNRYIIYEEYNILNKR